MDGGGCLEIVGLLLLVVLVALFWPYILWAGAIVFYLLAVPVALFGTGTVVVGIIVTILLIIFSTKEQ